MIVADVCSLQSSKCVCVMEKVWWKGSFIFRFDELSQGWPCEYQMMVSREFPMQFTEPLVFSCFDHPNRIESVNYILCVRSSLEIWM